MSANANNAPSAAGRPYAVIADIHGNEEALRTVLAHLDGAGIDTVYCLGDVVGYGSGSGPCLREVRARGIVCVQGNHDGQVRPPRDPSLRPLAQAGLDAALAQLTPEEIDWLAALPVQLSIENGHAIMAHGSLNSRDEYLLDNDSLSDNEARMFMKREKVLFFGHTHLPLVRGAGESHNSFHGVVGVALRSDEKYLVNPGSVGQPRDDNPDASLAVVYPREGRLEIVRLPYDVKAEQARMRQAGMPEKAWKRLSVGR